MTKKVICTSCGKELQIPQELTEYSCMYCGARMIEPPAPRADFDAVLPRLIGCVADYRGLHRRVTASEYQSAFEEYENGCADVIRALDAAVRSSDGAKTPLLEQAADRLLSDLDANWRASDDYKSSRKRRILTAGDKMVVALFFVPMVRKLRLSISEDFCAILHQKWMARYPKNPFMIGDYESIAEGFQRKVLGLCFITTAVCRARGLADDCAELTAFRAFRDGYLRACPDGAALIEEYYDVAPGIVTAIEFCADSAKTYERIRKTYLQPCYEDLQNGNLEACKNRYVHMVRKLEKEYLS